MLIVIVWSLMSVAIVLHGRFKWILLQSFRLINHGFIFLQVVTADIAFSKRYLKYLTKKYLKKVCPLILIKQILNSKNLIFMHVYPFILSDDRESYLFSFLVTPEQSSWLVARGCVRQGHLRVALLPDQQRGRGGWRRRLSRMPLPHHGYFTTKDYCFYFCFSNKFLTTLLNLNRQILILEIF